jgi:hypothetical protein
MGTSNNPSAAKGGDGSWVCLFADSTVRPSGRGRRSTGTPTLGETAIDLA